MRHCEVLQQKDEAISESDTDYRSGLLRGFASRNDGRDVFANNLCLFI